MTPAQPQGSSFLTLRCTTLDVKQRSSNPDFQKIDGPVVVRILEEEIEDQASYSKKQGTSIPGGLILRGHKGSSGEFPNDIRNDIIQIRCMVCRQVFIRVVLS